MDNLSPVVFRISFLFLLFFYPLFWAQSNQPPEISVSGRKPFCAGAPILIAENFTITDPDNDAVASFSVQISSGYVNNGSESLYVTGSHPSIESEFDFVEGKLTLTPSIASGRNDILYTDLIPAVRAIVYESLATSVSGERIFSFTIGDANYLPETGHYYEFIEANFITWENARVAAEQREYFGLKGYLATLLSREEAQFCGEQASGTGWIGGSDAEQEGVWKWMTGPEAGTVFWNGGISGSSPNFAFWNSGEPNNVGNEDYVHITDPAIGIPGSWNDLPLAGGTGLYAPRGYIVEYGGMPGDPELDISETTSIYIPEITAVRGAESCPNSSVVLEADVTEGGVYWYNSPIGGQLLGSGNFFTTPILSETTTYYVSAAPENCSNTARIPVVASVNPNPNVEDEVLLELCDDDQDGFARFDLTIANTLLLPNAISETFIYYPSEVDAQNDTNAIPSITNYQNQVSTKDTIWVRTTNTSNCFVVSKVLLEVRTTKIPESFEKTYEVCDDFTGYEASDSDGYTSFNFNNITEEILSFFPSEQQSFLSISHYPTEADAENESNEIIDLNDFRNTIANAQNIYTRVSHFENENCDYIGTHLRLNVLPSPQLFLDEWNLCDDAADGDDTNGIVQNINLADITPYVLGDQNPLSYTVTYHETAADASSGMNPISSPFTNVTAYSQPLFLRVENKETGCVNDRHSIELRIRPLPVIRDQVELKQCDTDTDGFITFNLNEAGFDISDNYQEERFIFYESLADAQIGSNPIENSTAYKNKSPTKDQVWARVISKYGCYRIAKVDLTVSTTGVPISFQRTFRVCDDAIQGGDTDGVSSFDFSSVTDDIKGLFPSNQELIIAYYRNLEDALAEQNAIEDPSNYRNIGYPHSQDVFIRVDSELDNDCLGLGHHITLEVEPVPLANPTADIELCDDLLSGSAFDGKNVGIDLSAKIPDILGPNQSVSDYKVSFHTSRSGAIDGLSDEIINDRNYTNAASPDFVQGTINEQVIYVRVQSLSGLTCYNANISFSIKIYPLPEVPTSISDLLICDSSTLSDPDPRNRKVQNIDLTSKEFEILEGKSGYRIAYYLNKADAQNGENSIPNPMVFENTSPETHFPEDLNSDDPAIQTIYFVVTDENGLQCNSLYSSFNLVIHPEPRVDPIPIFSFCDDAADGDDTNGLVQHIDFSILIPDIIGQDRNENEYTVSFHLTQEDADMGNGALTFPYENKNSRETIYVRVENNSTRCVSSKVSFQIVINTLPDIVVPSPQILCLNDLPYFISIENTSADYSYKWTNSEGEILGTDDYLPINQKGRYTVTATNRITQCSRTEIVAVDESNVALLQEDFVTIVDEVFHLNTSDVLSVSIDTINNDLGPGDYQFALRNTETNERIPFSGFQDNPQFEVTEGGIYEIIVNDKNGCIPDATLEVSVLQFPKFFTPNNDGINDVWKVKGANKAFYPNSSLRIFNRFGKLIYQFEAGDQGWDGTYNGNQLPSDDYWYDILMVPANPNKPIINRKGNFSLLRR